MPAEVTHGTRTRGFGFWGGEMKTVKITIEVEVSDNLGFVTVDENGLPCGHPTKPELGITCWNGEPFGFYNRLKVINWRETLTEVK
jgi:hypothetical protein